MAKLYTSWNPDDKYSDAIVLSNNNLTVSRGAGGGFISIRSVLNTSIVSGKIYIEVKKQCDLTDIDIGVVDISQPLGNMYNIPNAFIYRSTGVYYGTGGSPGHPAYFENDIVNIAIDFDDNKIWFGINGVWNDGDPATGLNQSMSLNSPVTYAIVAGLAGDSQLTANFGASDFIYSVPEGFLSGYFEDTSIYVLSGTVKDGATPLQRTVRVEKHSNKGFVGEQTSNTDGSFEFDSVTYPLLADNDTFDIFAYGDDTTESGQILSFGNVTAKET